MQTLLPLGISSEVGSTMHSAVLLNDVSSKVMQPDAEPSASVVPQAARTHLSETSGSPGIYRW